MRDGDNLLWLLVVIFAPLSLLSIGGWVSVLAPVHHQTVEVHGWLTQREFVDVFAITRAAPGPGAMIVALIGWKVAGWAGALVACLAIFIPSSVLVYFVGRVWNRYRGTSWHSALELGLAPVGVGLLMAGSLSIMHATESGGTGNGITLWAIAGLAAAVLAWRTFHPLIILACGGLISVAVGQLT
jgi:chromate transporter